MSSKKKKVYLLFLPLWMAGLCFFAYQIGYKKGLQHRDMTVIDAVSNVGDQANHKPKVERLTFFDTLHRPPQIPHEMIEPDQTASKDSTYVPMKTSVEEVVQQQINKKQLPQPVRKPVEIQVAKKTNPHPQDNDSKKEKNQIKQKVKTVSQEYTLKEIKRLAWAVQVGAFKDGVQAVLLQKELQKKGYPAFTAQASDALVKVYVGGATQNQSHRLKKDLENSGYLKTFVVKRAQ